MGAGDDETPPETLRGINRDPIKAYRRWAAAAINSAMAALDDKDRAHEAVVKALRAQIELLERENQILRDAAEAAEGGK